MSNNDFRIRFSPFRLTDEQQTAVSQSLRLSRIKIEALAGTGKTATLIEIARALKNERPDRRILYTAFNRKIVRAVESEMGQLAECFTMHQLAYHSVGASMCRSKLRDSPFVLNPTEGAQLIGADEDCHVVAKACHNPFPSKYEEYPIVLTKEMIFEFASQTVTRFCQSADLAIDISHVPEEIYCKCEPFSVQKDEQQFSDFFLIPFEVRSIIKEAALMIWIETQEPTSFRFPFRHDHYLKIWHLMQQPLPYDVILFDEAQDADPIMADIVNRHQGKTVWCGDRYQAIYEWRGAVNSMELVNADATIHLTRSFRFGVAIATVINTILQHLGAPRLHGDPAIRSQVGILENPDAEIYRSNTGALIRFVELAEQGIAVRVHFNLNELTRLVIAIEDLLNGRRPSHERLNRFESLEELVVWMMNQPQTEDLVQTIWRLLKTKQSSAGDSVSPLVQVSILREDTVEWITRLKGAIHRAGSRRGQNVGRFVGTIHSVKGLEFGSVFVGRQSLRLHAVASDWHLAYVALSRARYHLDYHIDIDDDGDHIIQLRNYLDGDEVADPGLDIAGNPLGDSTRRFVPNLERLRERFGSRGR